jgi:DNA invertase Pin-like site-specific DNA recombinase
VRVVGYVRVSTDRQVEEGLGLEIQEQAIRSWAGDKGHTLVALMRDEGQSGSNGIDTRIGLADALETLRDGRTQALVVYRLDRLARDLVIQEQLLAETWRKGCQVFSCSPPRAPICPMILTTHRGRSSGRYWTQCLSTSAP